MFKIPQSSNSDDENESVIRSKYFIAGQIFKSKTDAQTQSSTTDSNTKQNIREICSQTSSKPETNTNVTAKIATVIDISTDKRSPVITANKADTNRKPIVTANSNTILVNPNQKGNKLLRHLRVAYELNETVTPAHYIMFNSCCALFLSLKYHLIYPNYIYDKLTELGNTYQLKVLLLLVDHIEFALALKELTKLAIRANCSLMLAWSYEEAANYIENYKLYAERSPEIIMGKQNACNNNGEKQTAYQCLIEALTTVKSINKTDAVSLISIFDTFENIVKSDEELTLCPGMAMQKVERLREMFFRPFIRSE